MELQTPDSGIFPQIKTQIRHWADSAAEALHQKNSFV
jgi:hypothetical protein